MGGWPILTKIKTSLFGQQFKYVVCPNDLFNNLGFRYLPKIMYYFSVGLLQEPVALL